MQWYTQQQAADMLCIHRDELGRLAIDGKIRFALIGKRRKFSDTDIQQYMSECYQRAQKALEAPHKKPQGKKLNNVVGFMEQRRLRQGMQ